MLSTANQSPAIRTVAVIGCGTVGASWAALFLAGGFDVVAHDPAHGAKGALDAAIARARSQLADLGLDGQGCLRWADDPPEAARAADFIQENAPEDEAAKAALLADLDAAASPDAVIASSTSSLLHSAIVARCRNPARVILAHPFNPPHLVPLVEIFGTDDAVVARATAFYAGLGKVPVRLKREMRGHIANRLASALYREAVHLVEQGVASVADIDAALVNGPGARWAVMGAHLTYHLGGGTGGIRHYLDHLGPSQERRWDDLGAPRLTPALKARIIDGVEEEAAGRSVADLEDERDRALIAILRARRDGGEDGGGENGEG